MSLSERTESTHPAPVAWGGILRWTGIVIGAVLLAALITLYFLDWNTMRGPIGRYASRHYGREVRIDGNLAVKLFTLQPSIDVGGLFIGNPGWEPRPFAANVQHARVELRLLPLFVGKLILPLVSIDKPQLLVVRAPDGRTNWDSTSGNSKPLNLPPIHRFLVRDGHVAIDDAIRKLSFTGTVNSSETRGAGAAFTLTGDGTLNGNIFKADVKGGPLINVDESKPYAFNADITAGATHAVIRGSITRPFHLDHFTAIASLTGHNLSELYYLTGLALPQTPPYRLSGSLVRDGEVYRVTNMQGLVGSSDLGGALTVDATGKLPDLTGKLRSHVLGFDDLGSLFGGGKVQAPASPWLLPDTVLHTERLRQMSAQVDYTADSIRSRDFPLTGLSTHIALANGILDLKPLTFGFRQGKMSGSLKIDARAAEPVTSVDARITDIHAENFIAAADKPIQGTLEARARITGRGASVHRAASTASGDFTAVVPQGQMRATLANWLGVNVLTALGLTLTGDNSNTQLRCAVAHFTAQDGLLTSRQFVIDTDPTRVDAGGTINLKDETLNLRLQGKPKDFQLVRVRAPITVKGSLAHPALGIDTGPLVTQGGIGAALGLINPLASILAFIDPGLAKDANCAGLLTQAKAQGAPVKASAVAKAPAPRK
jgi:uncharacterized protein involved in outer membrane biogenesis